jgi:hypothetical protein
MCEIPDQSGSNSGRSIEGEAATASATSERGHGATREKTDYKLVRSANKKIRLITVLHSYGIHPIRNQFNSWSNHICPFHKGGQERTPSFGYNFEQDWFNCFSCKRHGRAVEFIAYKESTITKRLVTFNEVAGLILSRYDSDQELELGEDDSKKVEELLFGLSKFIQELIQQRKQDLRELEHVNKIIWCFDCYLDYAVPTGRITVEDLEERIAQVKGLLLDG